MVILSFSVLREHILDGRKRRTMRAVKIKDKINKKWQRVYDKFHANVKEWMCNCGDIYGEYGELCVCGTKAIHPVNSNGELYIIDLQIYWKSRSPMWICDVCSKRFKMQAELVLIQWPFCNTNRIHKESEKLFDGRLLNITKKKLGDLTEEECQLDGFEPTKYDSAKHVCWAWFSETYRIPLLDRSQAEKEFIPYSNDVLNFEVFIIEFEQVRLDGLSN